LRTISNWNEQDFVKELAEIEQRLSDEALTIPVTAGSVGVFPDLPVVPAAVASSARITKHTVIVASRNAVIDRCLAKRLTNREICKRLDFEFANRGTMKELPKSWVRRFGVKSFTEAYLHRECRKLLHRLINTRRKALRLRLGSSMLPTIAPK